MALSSRFTKYAWFVTFYTIGVILWGAIVRATGSGAGCGSHWPTCNGEILPIFARLETAIEFGHRVTSSLSGVLMIILVVWVFRIASSRFTRRMAVMSLVFIIIEGLIGAVLVRLDLVEDNASFLRAVAIALHFINTLVLLLFLTLTAWSSPQQESPQYQPRPAILTLMIIGLVGTAILSSIGAVTALGNTLFPSASLVEGIRADFDPASHFLIRLRIWHPIVAVVMTTLLIITGQVIMQSIEGLKRHVWLLYGILGVQFTAGVLNVVLLAPFWLQVVHLLMADLLWLTLITLAVRSITQPSQVPADELSSVSAEAPAR